MPRIIARFRRERILKGARILFRPFKWTHSLNNAHVTRYSLPESSKRFLSHLVRMFVQHAGPGGSVTKGSGFDRFGRWWWSRYWQKNPGLAPETSPREAVVRKKRVKSARGVFRETQPRELHACRERRKFRSEFFEAERCTRARASGRARNVFSPETAHSPRGMFALYFQERLRKAKEQEEVIHARHCYPTLGTLDRNRTWKPTRRLPPLASSSSSRPPARPFVAVATRQSPRLTHRIVHARERL